MVKISSQNYSFKMSVLASKIMSRASKKKKKKKRKGIIPNGNDPKLSQKPFIHSSARLFIHSNVF